MNPTALSQLQSVEAELASQESQIAAQITSVREKLAGIRAVMPMFSETTNVATEAIAPKELSSADGLEEPTETKATKPKGAAQTEATAKKKATVKQAPAKNADGRAAPWQKYTRPGVKNQSMPDAVRLILETQPENDFKIADVMEALFQEKMPRDQYLKARNRISNVLSGGVRAGDWYRGERSSYRMTEA